MNRKIAIDTNILVYCHSNDELDKQKMAISLFSFYPVISTQVLSEYINVVRRKLGQPKDKIMDVCLQNSEDFHHGLVVENQMEVINPFM
jgi:predicted nucleic acid-binding protein